jgi:pimeloyl-ACP methyl ester carboxylesterase
LTGSFFWCVARDRCDHRIAVVRVGTQYISAPPDARNVSGQSGRLCGRIPVGGAVAADHAPAGERLEEIRMPTLIVVGANDNPATLTRADRMASSITGGQKVVIADCGHMVNIDAPAPFNRAVLTFVRSKVAGYQRSRQIALIGNQQWMRTE